MSNSNNETRYPLFEKFIIIDGKRHAVFSTTEFADTKEEAEQILKDRGFYDD